MNDPIESGRSDRSTMRPFREAAAVLTSAETPKVYGMAHFLCLRARSSLILLLSAWSANAQSWTNIGPTGIPVGRVASVAIDPADLNHWLIGVGNGGVWQTRDGGNSFVPLSDSWPTLVIGAVAFAPSDPKI